MSVWCLFAHWPDTESPNSCQSDMFSGHPLRKVLWIPHFPTVQFTAFCSSFSFVCLLFSQSLQIGSSCQGTKPERYWAKRNEIAWRSSTAQETGRLLGHHPQMNRDKKKQHRKKIHGSVLPSERSHCDSKGRSRVCSIFLAKNCNFFWAFGVIL